jgi:hypothetical protein
MHNDSDGDNDYDDDDDNNIITKLHNMDYTKLYEVQLKSGKVCIA